MQYPAHLLPKENYTSIKWGGWLKDCHLLRHTPDNDLLDSETGLLKMDYIVPEKGTSQLKDFSTFLLGIFRMEDKKWNIIGERRHYFSFELWPQGEAVDPPLYPDDFNADITRGAFYLRIGDLAGQLAPYSIGGKENYMAECRILHTPTRSNFWHFSIRWFNEEGDIFPDQKGNWIKRMLKTAVKTLIQENAILELPPINPIDDKYYIIA